MREGELLDHIFAANDQLPEAVTIPPGDDMGALVVGDHQILVTVDQIADGVHFELSTTPLEKIARKALTRNLSDVAAMAAVPTGAVAAACLPRNFDQRRADALFDAMQRTAAHFECPMFGGDVAVWDHALLLAVTVLAKTDGIDPILRRGACVGDVICVTGKLGGSLHAVDGRAQHLDFEPRLLVARALAKHPVARPHCMIDLSDGLATDLGHLCRAGGVAAVVDARSLPTGRAAEVASGIDHRPPWWHALCDGEDYELCFTVKPDAVSELGASIHGVELSVVGVIESADHGPPVRVRLADGTQVPADQGWEHGDD